MIVKFYSEDIRNKLFVILLVFARNGGDLVFSAPVLHDYESLRERRFLFLTQTLPGNQRFPSIVSYTLIFKVIDMKYSFTFWGLWGMCRF